MRGCTAAALLSFGALALLGGAARGCDGPAAPEAEAPPRQAKVTPAPAPSASPPAGALRFSPDRPIAGAPVTITGGPISFRNGCEGIASVEVGRKGDRIEVRWTPKQVAPDALCTMALHDDPVVATVEGLEAGTYEVVILPSGGKGTLVVSPAPPAPGAGGPAEEVGGSP